VRTELAGVSATAFAIADNRTAELAEWEEDKLNAVLKSLQDEGVDLVDVGYSPEDVKIEAEKEAPQEFAEVDENIETEHNCPKCGYKWSGGQ